MVQDRTGPAWTEDRIRGGMWTEDRTGPARAMPGPDLFWTSLLLIIRAYKGREVARSCLFKIWARSDRASEHDHVVRAFAWAELRHGLPVPHSTTVPSQLRSVSPVHRPKSGTDRRLKITKTTDRRGPVRSSVRSGRGPKIEQP